MCSKQILTAVSSQVSSESASLVLWYNLETPSHVCVCERGRDEEGIIT